MGAEAKEYGQLGSRIKSVAEEGAFQKGGDLSGMSLAGGLLTKAIKMLKSTVHVGAPNTERSEQGFHVVGGIPVTSKAGQEQRLETGQPVSGSCPHSYPLNLANNLDHGCHGALKSFDRCRAMAVCGREVMAAELHSSINLTRRLSSITAALERLLGASFSSDHALAQAMNLTAVRGPRSNACKDSCPRFLSYAISIKDADGVRTPHQPSFILHPILRIVQHCIDCRIFIPTTHCNTTQHNTTNRTTPLSHPPAPPSFRNRREGRRSSSLSSFLLTVARMCSRARSTWLLSVSHPRMPASSSQSTPILTRWCRAGRLIWDLVTG